jgi:hypothetical protein
MRARAESLMSDTCRITRPGDGDPVFDPNTGTYTDPPPVTVYEGPCRIPSRDVSSSQANVAGASWTVGEFPLDLPVAGSESVAVGNTVTYVSSAHDPSLAGRVFGVVEVGRASQATARRLRVTENMG